MTLRAKLGLSYLSILGLFATNLAVYSWGNFKRNGALEELRLATERNLLLASVYRELSDLQQQVALTSQFFEGDAGMAMEPAEITGVSRQIDSVTTKIGQALELQGGNQEALSQLVETVNDLSDSWMVFYRNLGRNQSKAVIELVTKADPLSVEVLTDLLPALETEEAGRVEMSRQRFYEVKRLVDRASLIIFGVSILLAVFVALLYSRSLTKRLGAFKRAAASIGRGDLERRMDVTINDELRSLAAHFNEMAGRLQNAQQEIEAKHQEAVEQHERSDSLLRNILPEVIAEELKSDGSVAPKYFEDVTVLFTDFKGFTLSTEKLAADEVVDFLHTYFTRFDEIIDRYRLEKLKTIGDGYMAVSGLPERTPSHPVDAVMAGFEMLQAVEEFSRNESSPGWKIRIGLHTGPVIAGVVGIRKFAFDIWGDTVNLASRMESSGSPGQINLSEQTFRRVKDFFECDARGEIETKEKRKLPMFSPQRLVSSLMDDSGRVPPTAFRERYRVYFQKEPPAFPGFLLEREPPGIGAVSESRGAK